MNSFSFVQEIPTFFGLGPELGPEGHRSEPTASDVSRKTQNLKNGFGPGSGRSWALSCFVGSTGSSGPKSGSDWFFIKTESEPDLGPGPRGPNPLEKKGCPRHVEPHAFLGHVTRLLLDGGVPDQRENETFDSIASVPTLRHGVLTERPPTISKRC